MSTPVRQTLLSPHNLTLLITALFTIIADQGSKRLIEDLMPVGTSAYPISAIAPYFIFTHTQNTGAAFSMFQNGGMFFIVVGIVVCGVILFYTPRLPAKDWQTRLALGLQMGGIIGNLIDRLRQGYVTDFFHFQIPEIDFNFAVFNIADSCIFIGVVFLIIISFWRERNA